MIRDHCRARPGAFFVVSCSILDADAKNLRRKKHEHKAQKTYPTISDSRPREGPRHPGAICPRTKWTHEERCRSQARPHDVGDLSDDVVPGRPRLYFPVRRWRILPLDFASVRTGARTSSNQTLDFRSAAYHAAGCAST